MNNLYTLSKSKLTPVSCTALTVTKISESSSTTAGRKLFTFPCKDILSVVHVMVVKGDDSAPSGADILAYGASYSANDKSCELPVNENHDIYIYPEDDFTVNAQEWV